MNTHITLVCDRSGSMSSVRQAAEEAVNGFIKTQSEVGPGTLFVYDFDTFFEPVYKGSLQSFPNYTLRPRGGTALFDAIGKAINETGAHLRSLPALNRPDKVIMVIQTDGEENSSTEFSFDKLNEMVKHQGDVYNWEFVFLGAEMTPAAIQQYKTMFSNTVCYTAGVAGPQGVAGVYSAMNTAVTRSRMANTATVVTQDDVDNTTDNTTATNTTSV